MNPHLETLLMVKTLADFGDCTSATLQSMGAISAATLKRYVKEARHLGADVVSVRSGAEWMYRLQNADQVRARLSAWIELEQSRDLRGGEVTV